MLVAIVAAAWGRPQLIAPWWAQIHRIVDQWDAAGIDTAVIVAGSEPDHEAACLDNGGIWVHSRNRPLGRKHNVAAGVAQSLQADYMFVVGTDDFFSPELIAQYIPLIKDRVLYAGIKGCYFWEPSTDRIGFFEGYAPNSGSVNRSLGTGRLIHSSLLNRVNWQPWDRSVNSGLDHSLECALHYPKATLLQVGPEAVCLDVKTRQNIWSFNMIAASYPGVGNGLLSSQAILLKLPEHAALAALQGVQEAVPAPPVRSQPFRPRVINN